MNYTIFLNEIIKRGIDAASRDYARPTQADKLQGSIAGFQACCDKQPNELAELLAAARTATLDARTRRDRYWWYRCYEAEVEWVCNCVSVLLLNQGQPTIVPPTCRAVATVATIVGVA